jgi:hypothetical protein
VSRHHVLPLLECFEINCPIAISTKTRTTLHALLGGAADKVRFCLICEVACDLLAQKPPRALESSWLARPH